VVGDRVFDVVTHEFLDSHRNVQIPGQSFGFCLEGGVGVGPDFGDARQRYLVGHHLESGNVNRSSAAFDDRLCDAGYLGHARVRDELQVRPPGFGHGRRHLRLREARRQHHTPASNYASTAAGPAIVVARPGNTKMPLPIIAPILIVIVG